MSTHHTTISVDDVLTLQIAWKTAASETDRDAAIRRAFAVWTHAILTVLYPALATGRAGAASPTAEERTRARAADARMREVLLQPAFLAWRARHDGIEHELDVVYTRVLSVIAAFVRAPSDQLRKEYDALTMDNEVTAFTQPRSRARNAGAARPASTTTTPATSTPLTRIQEYAKLGGQEVLVNGKRMPIADAIAHFEAKAKGGSSATAAPATPTPRPTSTDTHALEDALYDARAQVWIALAHQPTTYPARQLAKEADANLRMQAHYLQTQTHPDKLTRLQDAFNAVRKAHHTLRDAIEAGQDSTQARDALIRAMH